MLTQFQKQFIRSLAHQPGFSHFCLGLGQSVDQYIQAVEADATRPGPVVVPVIAPTFQVYRVGQQRLIQAVL